MRHQALALLLLATAGSTPALSAQYLIKDINPGLAPSYPGQYVQAGNTMFCIVDDGVVGWELWKTDGTAAGTTLIKDITPGGSQLIFPNNFAAMGSTLFFTDDDLVNGNELWKSDGTAAGTVMVADIGPGSIGSNPYLLTPVGGTLFFKATDGVSGEELWKTDGTTAGTVLVADINPGSASSSPGNLCAVGGLLFFTASTPLAGRELWKSDGTVAGTVMVADIYPGPTASNPTSLVASAGAFVHFAANNGANGIELWRSDGTAVGTKLVTDIRLGTTSSSPTNLTPVGAWLLFTANNGTNGVELFVTDLAANTAMVADIRPGSASSSPASLTAVGNTLLFTANDGTSGIELWTASAPWTGASLVLDANPGSANGLQTGGYRLRSVADNTRVLMSADDGVHGLEPWVSDGTAAGTRMLKDLNPGPGTSSCVEFARYGDLVLITADDGTTGWEPYALPLAAIGAALAAPFGAGCPGAGGAIPALTGYGGPPVVGNAGFGVRVTNGLPLSSAALLLGVARADLPVGGGCTLDPQLPVPLALSAPTGAAGDAGFALAVPSVPALVGGKLVLQAGVVDPSGAWRALLSFSPGLLILVGQ